MNHITHTVRNLPGTLHGSFLVIKKKRENFYKGDFVEIKHEMEVRVLKTIKQKELVGSMRVNALVVRPATVI